MGTGNTRTIAILLALGVPLWFAPFTQAEPWFPVVFPEQKQVVVRDPAELPPGPVPDIPPPITVADPPTQRPPWNLSLDEAIRIAPSNTEVVRVLAGVTAVSSGRTIYDPAITNTSIDEQHARFDPQVEVRNGFNRNEIPSAIFDRLDPARARIEGLRRDDYRLDLNASQTVITGGSLNLGVTTNPTTRQPGVFPLNPENRSSLELSFTQPLLQGGGLRANLAPVVLARIDTERSFFQLKDSLQELVRSVVEAYWSLIFARTDMWALERQVEQLQQAYERARVQRQLGLVSRAEEAQTRVALSNFEASEIGARANLLQREAALRSILGLPPNDTNEIIPTTPPFVEPVRPDWQPLVELAAERRPDIIELKLILEADQQNLLLARNGALPRVDAVALYRWNGLEGEMPGGGYLASQPGAFTDWTLGVNFSVPLGLRRERANLRRQELLIARDRASLEQGMQEATQLLANNLRNLALAHAQYDKFREVRAAARINLEQQIAEYISGRTIFLNVLLAVTDWGNAVSSEAQTLLQYNTELANLERQTGTILETHGVRFFEERFGAIGPLGFSRQQHCYPSAITPTPNADRYPAGEEAAENSFDLEDPLEDLRSRRRRQQELELLPPPDDHS